MFGLLKAYPCFGWAWEITWLKSKSKLNNNYYGILLRNQKSVLRGAGREVLHVRERFNF